MGILSAAEQQTAAVRVDRGQVDVVPAQKSQQQVRADVPEVAGDDAVEIPRLCAEILQQRGERVAGGGGRWRFRTMRSFRAFGYSPALPYKRPKT